MLVAKELFKVVMAVLTFVNEVLSLSPVPSSGVVPILIIGMLRSAMHN